MSASRRHVLIHGGAVAPRPDAIVLAAERRARRGAARRLVALAETIARRFSDDGETVYGVSGLAADVDAARKLLDAIEGRATAAVVSEIDRGWIDFVTGGPSGYGDVFAPTYCGYWLFGVEHDQSLGWLAFELAGDVRRPGDKASADAVKLWRDGAALPPRFFRLDAALAAKAWIEGFKHGGAGWYAHGDGAVYDSAIQRALFGEARYG